MKRIDSSTVELTQQEQALSALHDTQLDAGLGQVDAFVEAWRQLGQFGWLPSPDFCEWLIGPLPSDGDIHEDEVLYAIHCEMASCPDHGSVRLTEGGDAPGMAGGSDYWWTYSCGCTITGSAMGASRRRQDGTYGPVESEDSL